MPIRSRLPLSPECRLVFGAAHVAPDDEALQAALTERLDWARVVMIAERERATPVLWRALERVGMHSLPEAAAHHLKRSATVYDFRMMRLATRLERTLGVLHSANVPVLLLKGAALATTVYDGFTHRPMTDVDMLVRTSDVPVAREAIIASGWPETSDPMLLSLLADHHHLPHFVDSEATGLRIELHTRMLPPEQPFALDERRVWADARPARRPFDTALVANPVELMLHASLHFAWSHTMRFGAWRTFRDVSALARDHDFPWDRFVAVARETKALTSCYWTLRLAQQLSGVEVPSHVMTALTPPTPAPLRHAIERHFITMIAPGEAPPCPSIKLARALWRAALRPKWSGHAHAGHADPEQRWERARGTESTETVTERIARHVAGIGHWWAFTTRTLGTVGRNRRHIKPPA